MKIYTSLHTYTSVLSKWSYKILILELQLYTYSTISYLAKKAYYCLQAFLMLMTLYTSFDPSSKENSRKLYTGCQNDHADCGVVFFVFLYFYFCKKLFAGFIRLENKFSFRQKIALYSSHSNLEDPPVLLFNSYCNHNTNSDSKSLLILFFKAGEDTSLRPKYFCY